MYPDAYIQIYPKDISDAISSRKNDHLIHFTPAEESEQVRHVKIPLKRLEPIKSHYSRLRGALQDMATKLIAIPHYTASHAMEYEWFRQLFMVEFSIESHVHYTTLHFKLPLLKRFLSNCMGYHRINLDTYFSFKYYSTRQLYRFYYAHFKKGYTYLKPEFLAQTLSAKGNYNSSASARKNLTGPARKEMESMFRNEQCEVYFRYKEIYPDDNPNCIRAEKVIFTFINRQDIELSESANEQLIGYQTKIKVALTYVRGMDEKAAIQLCKHIQFTMMNELDALFSRKSWFVKRMKSKGTPIRNTAGYIRKSLENFLNEFEEKKSPRRKGHREGERTVRRRSKLKKDGIVLKEGRYHLFFHTTSGQLLHFALKFSIFAMSFRNNDVGGKVPTTILFTI